MARNKKMCEQCPYRNNGNEFAQMRDEVLPQIDRLMLEGKFKGPHACHMLTEEMEPASPKQECPGHRKHMEEMGWL